ncbi:MAG TPA: hypothetical protein VN083_06510, partial [Vicinamibacteria bacterium]|nr:hypothetical protein [Vicinamibacteria bacterium]
YNLVLMLIYVFDAMAARHLARTLGIDAIGSWAAGALYSFHTFQINTMPRINTVFHGFLPLSLCELILYLRTGNRRHAWYLGGLMLLQGLADNYTVVYGALLLGLVTVIAVAARPSHVAHRVPGLVLPALAAGALFSPIVLAYVGASRIYGYARGLPAGIDLERYLTTIPTNLIYGAIHGQAFAERNHPHFVGFLALSLAAAALIPWALFRETGLATSAAPREADSLFPSRVWVPTAAALALLFVAFSLGSDVVVFGRPVGPGPYRLLHDFVPGFRYLRFPERLSLIAMLFVALLAGRALTLLGRHGLSVPALLLAALLPIEHLSPLPTSERVPVEPEVPEVYHWLARSPVHALAEVPIHGFGLIRKEVLEEYFSTYHFKPIIHGLVTFAPPLSRILRQMADEFPSDLSLQAFQRVGVDTVVVHWGRGGAERLRPKLEADEAAGRLVRRARFEGPEGHTYEGGTDEVWGLVPTSRAPAAPFPAGHPVRSSSWRYAASGGNPSLAGDGDLATAWEVPGELEGNEFIQVSFGGDALPVTGVVLPEVRETTFPTHFRLKGRVPDGRWIELARMDDAHVLQRVDRLLLNPGRGALGFKLEGQELTAIRLLVAKGGRSFDGWVLPEIEIWVD